MEITQAMLKELLETNGVTLSDEDSPQRLEDCTAEQRFLISDRLMTLYQWDSAVNLAIAKGCDFQTLFDLTEPLLGCPAILFDYLTHVNAYTKNTETDDTMFSQTVELGQMSEDLMNSLIAGMGRVFPQINSDTPVLVSHSISAYPEVICQVRVEERYIAFLYVQCNWRKPSPGFLDFIKLFAEKLMLLAERGAGEQAGVQINMERTGHMLSQIILGALREPDMIYSATRQIGIPPIGEFSLYLLPNDSKQLMLIQGALSFLFGNTVTFHCEDYLLILFFWGWKNRTSDTTRAKLDLHLSGCLSPQGIICGCSRKFTDLVHLPEAYWQAKESFAAAEHLRNRTGLISDIVQELMPRGALARFEEYQNYILLRALGPEKARSFCEQCIREMAEADRQNGSDACKVLYTYLTLGRSVNQTADILHRHRNSIVYRINRCCEKYGLNLDDNQQYQRILLSFAVMELFDSA